MITAMPELSRFFGIIIRMFSEPSERHSLPHFHAYYQEHVAVFSISPVALMAGLIPQRQQRLIEAWAELSIKRNCLPIESFCWKVKVPPLSPRCNKSGSVV